MCNWRRLTRKSLAGSAEQSKTLDNIPASCLKINNPDPGGERTRDGPHTAVSFSPVHSPTHPSIFPSSTLRQKPQTQPSVSLSPFQFFFCLFLLIYCSLQQAGLQKHQRRILGNSCKMIHHLADLYHMHAFLCLRVHV